MNLFKKPSRSVESFWHHAWTSFFTNSRARFAYFLLGGLVLLSLLGQWLSPHSFEEVFWQHVASPPSFQDLFFFGTDTNGRDLFLRTLFGMRISLMIGLISTFVSLIIGVTYGAIAGYFGGRLDAFMMRIVDILFTVPFIFFVILLMVCFGRNLVLIFVALGAVEWLTMARIVRGQTLNIRQRVFIQAAHSIGSSHPTILWRHILPNILGAVIVYMTMTIPQAILLESILSFLGLGVQEPYTSLGVLISEGSQNLEQAPWSLVFPAIILSLMIYALTELGETLREALQPQEKRGR